MFSLLLAIIYLAFISTVSLDMLVKKTWRFRQGAEGVVQFYGFWYGVSQCLSAAVKTYCDSQCLSVFEA